MVIFQSPVTSLESRFTSSLLGLMLTIFLLMLNAHHALYLNLNPLLLSIIFLFCIPWVLLKSA